MQYQTAFTAQDFASNLARVRSRIDEAARKVGREGSEIRLLPVSKTVPEQRLRVAIGAGCHQLGENKVQEALRKYRALADEDVRWSIIGHLQMNKARDVVSFADEFHALDSLRLAEALDRRLQVAGRGLDVYVQVNTSGEQSKYGLSQEELPGFLTQLTAFSSLRVKGLMTLALFTADVERVRECFRLLRRLRDTVRETAPDLIGDGGLSMGMSGDYEIAIEEGATVVRVGQAIFGERSTPDDHYWPTGSSGNS